LILFQKFVKPSPLELYTFWVAIPSLEAQPGLGRGAKAASADWQGCTFYGARVGCPLSHDLLLHTSLRGPKRFGLGISDLNKVVTLVEGISGACEERYFSLSWLVRIKHSLRGLHFLV
jgi:hypothetical protein